MKASIQLLRAVLDALRKPDSRAGFDPAPPAPALLLSSTSANAAPDEVPPAFRQAILRHFARKAVRSADPLGPFSSAHQKAMQERARAMYGPK